ncbi:adenine deaminase [Ferruginibacter sp. SUN106]|uniref:adenine deaminase n=1 Tax=Ferruginibacter sp. SUN106 TaxID=2978348 RepID=UPI003D369F3E
MNSYKIQGNIVDIFQKKIFYGEITVAEGKISSIQNLPTINYQPSTFNYILPGFIDSHVHIESSMLVPSEFAKLAVVHGTVATISDPHEIANVCGMAGVEFMIANGKTVPFKFHFGAPSCVPATIFETAGAVLDVADVDTLLQSDDIFYLSEMMNFPGVLHADETVLQKIAASKKYNKPVDGHAPGLMGELAKKYIDAGISTDHECFTAAEALDKLNYGMKILIREGSAAKNFEALIELMHEHYAMMMFCSDDKHPDSLVAGHINQLCARAVAKGIDIFKVLQAACINPALHYKMKVGLLRAGDAADFIVVEDLANFKVLQTYIDGVLVAANGVSKIKTVASSIINQFDCEPIIKGDLYIHRPAKQEIEVIEALDGQLITNKYLQDVEWLVEDDEYEMTSNPEIDVLKIVVVNRYIHSKVAIAFIKNFGLKQGAIASSVAHDSHNIVAVGTDDESLMKAVNLVIAAQGGVSAVSNTKEMVLALPVAGLMSNDDGYKVATAYTAIDKMVKEELGSTLTAPFMTLSFMALLVIPHLKLSDMGLFDGDEFKLISNS